jgi:hypothetical protein
MQFVSRKNIRFKKWNINTIRRTKKKQKLDNGKLFQLSLKLDYIRTIRRLRIHGPTVNPTDITL